MPTPLKPKRRRRHRPSAEKSKQQPPYAVTVLNDDEHTLRYVVETFMRVFGYPMEKSFSLTLQIHNEGRGIVWSGAREVAELKRDQIRSAGPDFYRLKKVEFPLGVTVEPLAGCGGRGEGWRMALGSRNRGGSPTHWDRLRSGAT